MNECSMQLARKHNESRISFKMFKKQIIEDVMRDHQKPPWLHEHSFYPFLPHLSCCSSGTHPLHRPATRWRLPPQRRKRPRRSHAGRHWARPPEARRLSGRRRRRWPTLEVSLIERNMALNRGGQVWDLWSGWYVDVFFDQLLIQCLWPLGMNKMCRSEGWEVETHNDPYPHGLSTTLKTLEVTHVTQVSCSLWSTSHTIR